MVHYDNMSIESPEWDGDRERSRHCGGCRRTRTLPSVPSGRIPKAQLTEVSHHLFALPIVALAWRERYHWIKGWR